MEKQFHKSNRMQMYCKFTLFIFIAICFSITQNANAEIVGNKILNKFSQKNKSATKQYKPVNEMYEDATKEIEKLEFKKASEILKEIQETYPFSVQSNKAVLLSAYSNYMLSEFELAIIDIERFISTNPYHQHRDYAFYLRSMILYKKLLLSNNDTSTAKQAQISIEKLLQEYPSTKYALSMSFKLNFVKHNMALKNMLIGRFYAKHGNCISALYRFEHFLKNQQENFYTSEALYRVFSCYKMLGIENQANYFYNLIRLNYPFSLWHDEILKKYPEYEFLEIKNGI